MQIQIPPEIEKFFATPWFWIRAWKDALLQMWELLSEKRLAAATVAVVVFVTTALLNKYLWGRDEDMRPMISGAVALALTGFLVLATFFVIAPFRLYDVERQRAQIAEDKLAALNKKQSKIVVRLDRPNRDIILMHADLTNNGPDDSFTIECRLLLSDRGVLATIGLTIHFL
jgi:hypothetical protein